MAEGDLDAASDRFKAVKNVIFSIRHAPRPALCALLVEYTQISGTYAVYSYWPDCTEFIITGYVLGVRVNQSSNPMYYISDGSKRVCVHDPRDVVHEGHPFRFKALDLVRVQVRAKPAEHKLEVVTMARMSTILDFITSRIQVLHTYLQDMCFPKHWTRTMLVADANPVVARVNEIMEKWTGLTVELEEMPLVMLCAAAVKSTIVNDWLRSLWLRPNHTETYVFDAERKLAAMNVFLATVGNALKCRQDIAREIAAYLCNHGVLVYKTKTRDNVTVTVTSYDES